MVSGLPSSKDVLFVIVIGFYKFYYGIFQSSLCGTDIHSSLRRILRVWALDEHDEKLHGEKLTQKATK